MSITSDEVNYLIYRYLCESGFVHSAYTFGAESLAAQANPGTEVPTGGLITYLQKGLQYREIETHLNTDGTCTEPFELLRNHVCSTKRDPTGAAPRALEGAEDGFKTPGITVPQSQVLRLSGHTADVFVCSFNPKDSFVLASGSADSSARVWTVRRPLSDGQTQLTQSIGEPPKPRFKPLGEASFSGEELRMKTGDVTTLDWHPAGQLLSTGSSGDGCVRIWSARGELVRELSEHKGPVFKAKFNRSGDTLLSGSVDTTTIAWDPHTGAIRQRYSVHQAPVIDVDWRDDTTFATCSQDKTICVCEIGSEKPVARFEGHSDEVNIVRWSPSGDLLASCSDDLTAKIWKLGQPTCVHDLRTHTKEIYNLKWSPTGPGSDNPNADLLLASGCADTSVKLWDPITGKERFTLSRHDEPVYSVAFSPDGQFLASGSFDKKVHVWSVKDGSLVRTFTGEAGVYEVCWNSDGTILAAGCTNNEVCLIDFNK